MSGYRRLSVVNRGGLGDTAVGFWGGVFGAGAD